MTVRGEWRFVAILIALFFCPWGSGPAWGGDVILGSGDRAGPSFQVGWALCRLVNRTAADHGLSCGTLPTSGGLFNLSNVRGGAIEFGLVRSDLQHHAVNQSGPFEFMDDTYGNLRALFSLNAELLTILARRDSGVGSIGDLKGRRVNIGDWGSAQRELMESLIGSLGWSEKDFLLIEELPAAQQSLAFCHDRVDAIVYAASHPDAAVRQVMGLCDAALVDVTGPAVERLLADKPYLVSATIPADSYPGGTRDSVSIGVRLTVVSAEETDEETVYAFAKAVFDNLDMLKRMNPVLQTLDRDKMVTDGLTAPRHRGMERYLEEAGLM